MPLQVVMLGKLAIEHDGCCVQSFPTQQVEELLGYLFLSPTAVHPRVDLISLLWPDVEVAQARHRFSIVLSRIRKLFQKLNVPFDGCFVASREAVRIVPERPFSSDRDAFVAACKQGFRQSEIEHKEASLRQALRFYNGDLLMGIHAEWCLVERESLARQRLRALGELMSCCQKRQNHEEAIELGHTILADDPLREEVHRALMISYSQQGQFSEMAKQFQVLRAVLWEELRELPMVPTLDLYSQLLSSHTAFTLTNMPQKTAVDHHQLHKAMTEFDRASKRLLSLLREF